MNNFYLHRCCVQNRRAKNKQSGTVLVTVLLVVVFVAILVVEVNKTVARQANLNRNLIHRDQAFSYLNGMEELAKIYMKKAFDAEKEDTVHLGQEWAQQDITFPIDGGVMSAKIVDMQSCLNLNSLSVIDKRNPNTGENNEKEKEGDEGTHGNPSLGGGNQNLTPTGQNQITTSEEILTTLLEKIIDSSEVQPSALAAAARDWIDTDVTPSGPDGVEDLYYQGLDIPYLTANGPIAHVSELRAIKSFDKKTYERLRHYVCVLPDGKNNKLNVNTIPLEKSELLYAALGGKVTQSEVKTLISERPEKGYEMQEFWEKVGPTKTVKKNLKQRLDITSSYFLMDAKAEIESTKVYMKTLFVKEDNNNFKVVSRYFGKE